MGDLVPAMDTPVIESSPKANQEDMASVVDPDTLIAQLKLVSADPSVLKGASDSQLREIKRLARSTSHAIEQPFETMVRIAYSVSDRWSPTWSSL